MFQIRHWALSSNHHISWKIFTKTFHGNELKHIGDKFTAVKFDYIKSNNETISIPIPFS